MTTFSPPINPSRDGTSVGPKVRVNRVDFGDGYNLRAPDGLNYIKREGQLVFRGLTSAQLSTLNTFCETTVAGYLPFEYTLPWESSSRKFTCKEWQVQVIGPDVYGFTMTIEEVFDL
ncbi:MAG: phage tail protein [Caulobacteraceae bacterium]|nr:phage tail protein [Caulobacteraceae bacterium]